MIVLFYLVGGFSLFIVGLVSLFWPPVLWSLALLLPLLVMGLVDSLQKRQGVRRNFPIIGNLRYFFESIRPELQQYFVESNLSGRPVPREIRSVVYQRAKGELQSVAFGTQRDVDVAGHEWIAHSVAPAHVSLDKMSVAIGGPLCKRPYKASLFNISAMSYGALSNNAIIALNQGAAKGGFYHNTGEGGVSPYHLKGGDLVWQIGTGYFGCRTLDGQFCPSAFYEKANFPQVKMIEVKLSQGAKPGKGGLLPAKKVNAEIAQIRNVPLGKDVISPPCHSAFSTPIELLEYLHSLRELSGGKPVGFKMCVGKKSEVVAICKAMLETQLYPDFITIDGSEGGTGAAPLEFTNSVGTPLEEGLVFVDDLLTGYGLRNKIRLICAGKVFTSFHILSKLALGADLINSARGMMLALGCIQALKCNTNKCPVGIATTNPWLVRGLYVPDKAERVARYHNETIHALAELLGVMGYNSSEQISRKDVFRRLDKGREIATYQDLYPGLPESCLLDMNHLPSLNHELLEAIRQAKSISFA